MRTASTAISPMKSPGPMRPLRARGAAWRSSELAASEMLALDLLPITPCVTTSPAQAHVARRLHEEHQVRVAQRREERNVAAALHRSVERESLSGASISRARAARRSTIRLYVLSTSSARPPRPRSLRARGGAPARGREMPCPSPRPPPAADARRRPAADELARRVRAQDRAVRRAHEVHGARLDEHQLSAVPPRDNASPSRPRRA